MPIVVQRGLSSVVGMAQAAGAAQGQAEAELQLAAQRNQAFQAGLAAASGAARQAIQLRALERDRALAREQALEDARVAREQQLTDQEWMADRQAERDQTQFDFQAEQNRLERDARRSEFDAQFTLREREVQSQNRSARISAWGNVLGNMAKSKEAQQRMELRAAEADEERKARDAQRVADETLVKSIRDDYTRLGIEPDANYYRVLGELSRTGKISDDAWKSLPTNVEASGQRYSPREFGDEDLVNLGRYNPRLTLGLLRQADGAAAGSAPVDTSKNTAERVDKGLGTPKPASAGTPASPMLYAPSKRAVQMMGAIRQVAYEREFDPRFNPRAAEDLERLVLQYREAGADESEISPLTRRLGELKVQAIERANSTVIVPVTRAMRLQPDMTSDVSLMDAAIRASGVSPAAALESSRMLLAQSLAAYYRPQQTAKGPALSPAGPAGSGSRGAGTPEPPRGRLSGSSEGGGVE